MATITVTWDSSFEGTPAGSSDPREGDNKIRELKTALSERLKREHFFTPGTDNTKHGLHREGAARGYVIDSNPANNPAGDALGSDDQGRLLFRSDVDYVPFVYDSGWKPFIREIARWSIQGGLSTGSNVVPRIVVPQAAEVVKVVAFVETPPSGGALVLDIEDSSGNSLFSAGSLSIADGDSVAGTTVIDSTYSGLSASDTLILDIDSFSGSPAGLSITVEMLVKV